MSPSRAIPLHRSNMRRPREIRRRAGGEFGIEFDRGYSAYGADQPRENCCVIADAGADMHDMLPRLRRGGGNQRRMKRGLAVVQVTPSWPHMAGEAIWPR